MKDELSEPRMNEYRKSCKSMGTKERTNQTKPNQTENDHRCQVVLNLNSFKILMYMSFTCIVDVQFTTFIIINVLIFYIHIYMHIAYCIPNSTAFSSLNSFAVCRLQFHYTFNGRKPKE